MSRLSRRILCHSLSLLLTGGLALSGCASEKANSSHSEATVSSAPQAPQYSASSEPAPVERQAGADTSASARASGAASGPRDQPAATPAPAAPPPAPAAEEERSDRASAPDISRKAGRAGLGRRARQKRSQLHQPAPMQNGGGGLALALADPTAAPDDQSVNTEDYRDYGQNPWTLTSEDRLSTFAIDVDTASYAIARRKLASGQVPPPASVRVEEFVNYFGYDYAGPDDGRPFAVHVDAAPSPFTAGRHLVRVGVQAKRLSLRERKNAHLVFLVDVSGSMQSADKLGLAKRALRVLLDNLKDGDTVSLVTYAGNTRVVLEPTGLEHKYRILSALEDLTAGGSTNMGSGLSLAYDMAARNLGPDSVSRVLVLSDGDANVGNTSHDDILATIRGQVKEGVTLSTIGFGMGNYKDTLMEQLANKGNGNYYYIDGMDQARRTFQEQLGGTLEVVAKDVKIQVEMDPNAVTRYRLIGYENRDVADADFRNDRVDAGEIGAGHSVTALYEVELSGQGKELATVRIRAKAPRGTRANESTYRFGRDEVAASFAKASPDFRFATAVMAAAELLRRSPHAADWSMGAVKQIAADATKVTGDAHRANERRGFLEMMAQMEKQRHALAQR